MEAKRAKKRYRAEGIINILRQAEIEQSRGMVMAEVCKKVGIREQTYYRWRKEYGGLRVEEAKRLKDLEKENQRLRKIISDQALDNTILKEALSGND